MRARRAAEGASREQERWIVAESRARAAPRDISLSLLGGFRVFAADTEVHVSNGTQHLLAFLALRASWAKRTLVAGTLWPGSSDARAYACLRSALSRMERPVRNAIEVTQMQLRLAQGVVVDLARGRALAQRILENRSLSERDTA